MLRLIFLFSQGLAIVLARSDLGYILFLIFLVVLRSLVNHFVWNCVLPLSDPGLVFSWERQKWKERQIERRGGSRGWRRRPQSSTGRPSWAVGPDTVSRRVRSRQVCGQLWKLAPPRKDAQSFCSVTTLNIVSTTWKHFFVLCRSLAKLLNFYLTRLGYLYLAYFWVEWP